MSYLRQIGTGRIYHSNKELALRKDMQPISDAEAQQATAGTPSAPVVHAPAPVATAAPVSAHATPESNQPEDAMDAAMIAALASVEACTDKDALEDIGRAYDVELDKRIGVEKARKVVKEAVVEWFSDQKLKASKK